MTEELAVWLYGEHVATIDRLRERLRLSYTDAARRRYLLGTPLLSLSLPVDSRVYAQGVTRSFLDGLLPEGEARGVIARDFGLSRDDTYGLIRLLGRDCAGAMVIQPVEEAAPRQSTTMTAEPLEDRALEDLVRNLRSAPLGAGGRVRLSLAGVQEKLLLTRMSDGRWGRPVDGTPSTHILKPEIAAYPNTVENEAFCMRFAKHLGLDVAEVETTEIADRKLLVVERFDRTISSDGSVDRIHQEDFCQATGTSPDLKYQENGGPSLNKVAELVSSTAAPGDLERLLQAVTVNVLLGNGDAHAKNFSLIHEPSGAMRLAPLYDLMCTLAYGDDSLAMYIDDVRRTNRVSADRILNESARWGIARTRATEILGDLLERAPLAEAAAAEETAAVPVKVIASVRDQLKGLREAVGSAG